MYIEDNGSTPIEASEVIEVTEFVSGNEIRSQSLTTALANVFAKHKDKDLIRHGGDVCYFVAMKEVRFWFFLFGYKVTIQRANKQELYRLLGPAMESTANGELCHVVRYFNDLVYLTEFWEEFLDFMYRKMTADSPIPIRVITQAVVKIITSQKPKKRFWSW